MIQVLCVDLSSADEGTYNRLYGQASPARKARADRYRRREDALRCVAADALLRRILGTDYCRMEKTADGKPFLPERPDFHFNLSHSGNWAVIAWGSCEVGVDVEAFCEHTNMEAITRRFFAEEEQRYIFAEESHRRERFFEIWTGKESYLKYLGTGLKKDLTSFSVLSLEQGIRMNRKKLPDGSWLSLCATENDVSWEMMDVRHL